MKNADKPINPHYYNGRMQTEKTIGHANSYLSGLTKREYFAAMAMQGILASNNRMSVAENAIKFADALLKQLDQ